MSFLNNPLLQKQLLKTLSSKMQEDGIKTYAIISNEDGSEFEIKKSDKDIFKEIEALKAELNKLKYQ